MASLPENLQKGALLDQMTFSKHHNFCMQAKLNKKFPISQGVFRPLGKISVTANVYTRSQPRGALGNGKYPGTRHPVGDMNRCLPCDGLVAPMYRPPKRPVRHSAIPILPPHVIEPLYP
jgi:hypothetical protein